MLNSRIVQYHTYRKYTGNIPEAPELRTPRYKDPMVSTLEGFHCIMDDVIIHHCYYNVYALYSDVIMILNDVIIHHCYYQCVSTVQW